MNDGFVKLYGGKLLDSTLWLEDPSVRLVFLAMLAMADADGIVDLPGTRVLARRLNLPLDYVEGALDVLMAPDKDSRSKELEGRRVVELEVGWQCVNYAKYREYRGKKQEQARVRQERFRNRSRADAERDSVTSNARNAPEAEAEDQRQRQKQTTPLPPTGGDGDPLVDFAAAWRKLTGRSEFKELVEGCGGVGGTEQEWLINVRRICDGSAAEFTARVAARLAEDDRGFARKQTLHYWRDGLLQTPAKPPAATAPAAPYHKPMKPRAAIEATTCPDNLKPRRGSA